MRRIIDCTYLHAVVRCLRGEASHFDDLTTFLRLVAEILVADRIFFTADHRGPVYKPAIAAARELTASIGDATLLSHFEVDAINYADACEHAALDVATDLRSMGKFSEPVGAISPVFDSSPQDPDAAFFWELRTALASTSPVALNFALHPANAARFVLTRPKVLDALRKSCLLDTFTGEQHFVRLTAAVRTIIYRHIGAQLGATYLPASSRANLLPMSHRDPYSVGGMAEGVFKASDSPFSLASGVDAIVRLSSGEPKDIIRRAWQYRGAVFPVRDLLCRSAPGDALGASFRRVSDGRALASHLANILEGEDGPLLADCLEIQFILFAIPILTLHPGKLLQWTRRKRALRRIGKFADLLTRAEELRNVSIYETLARKVGLKHESITRSDAPGDHGATRDRKV